MASVFVLLEAFNRKEAAALGFFPCATASFLLYVEVNKLNTGILDALVKKHSASCTFYNNSVESIAPCTGPPLRTEIRCKYSYITFQAPTAKLVVGPFSCLSF